MAAALVYAALWAGTVGDWAWIAAVDDGVLQWFHRVGIERPGWVGVWDVLSDIVSPNGMRVVAVVVIVVVLVWRRPRVAVFLGVTVGLMGLVTVVAKALADRPRPGTALVSASSSSFPSGHALGVMAAMLAFLVVLWPLASAAGRWWGSVVAGVVIVLAGVSRVVLNVHHPSDVLAGWALGYLWFALCVRMIPPFASTRRQEDLSVGV